MLSALAVSLLLTLLLEEGFALCWGLRDRRELYLVALVNCLTNPPAVLLRWSAVLWWALPEWTVILPIEAAVVLIEWLCYRRGSEQLRRPFLFALLCNAFSYSVGCLLHLL